MHTWAPHLDTRDAAATTLDWDDEVDVVCVGSGSGLLAAALVAARAGDEVYVGTVQSTPRIGAGCGQPWGAELSSRLGVDDTDDDTVDHFCRTVEEFGPVVDADADVLLPVRILRGRAPSARRRSDPVPAFRGADLGGWARRCAASPNGVLFNRVTRRHMTEARAASGVALEVAVIGAVGGRQPATPPGLSNWLRELASSEGVGVEPVQRLSRLVFEEGDLVGVVVDTAAGPWAVRAHRDVIVGIGDPGLDDSGLIDGHGVPSDMRLCLVSQFASRFARLELVTDHAPQSVEQVPSRVCAGEGAEGP